MRLACQNQILERICLGESAISETAAGRGAEEPDLNVSGRIGIRGIIP